MPALAEHFLHLLPAEGTPLAVLVFGGLTADLEGITGIFTDPDKFEELKACSSPSGTAFSPLLASTLWRIARHCILGDP